MSKANSKLVKNQKNIKKKFSEQKLIESTIKMDPNLNSSNEKLYFTKNNLIDSNNLVLKNQINYSINQFTPNQFIDLANFNSLLGTNNSTDAMNSLLQLQCEKNQSLFNLKNFAINQPNFNINQLNLSSKLPNINKTSDNFNFSYLNSKQPKSTTVFVCNVCGQDLPTLEAFDEHEATNHPNVLCTYYETDNQEIEIDSKIKNTTINQNFSLNNLKKVIETTNNTEQCASPKEIKTKKIENKVKTQEIKVTNYNCTKCKANFSEISKFHEHILDCATSLEEHKKTSKKKVGKKVDNKISKNSNNDKASNEIVPEKKLTKVVSKGKLNTNVKETIKEIKNSEKTIVENDKNKTKKSVELESDVSLITKNEKSKNCEEKSICVNDEITKKEQLPVNLGDSEPKKVNNNFKKSLNVEKFYSTKVCKDKLKNAKAIKGKYMKKSKLKNKQLKSKEKVPKLMNSEITLNFKSNNIKNENEEINSLIHNNLSVETNVNKNEEISSKNLRTRKVLDKKINKKLKDKLAEKINKKSSNNDKQQTFNDKAQIENQQVVNIIEDQKIESNSIIKKISFSGESILQKSDSVTQKEISLIKQENSILNETKKKRKISSTSLLDNKKPLKAFNISTIKLNSSSNDIFSVTTIGSNRIIINKNILTNKFDAENSLNQNDLHKKDLKNEKKSDDEENSQDSSLFYEQYLQSKIPKNLEEINKKVKSLSIKNYRLKNDYYSKKNTRLNKMRKPYKSVLNNKNSMKNINETIKERLRKKNDKKYLIKKKELKPNKFYSKTLIKKKELKHDLDFEHPAIDQSLKKNSDSLESQNNLIRRSSRISNIKSYNETDEKIDDNFVCWKCNEEFKEKKLLTKHSFNCKKSKQKKLDITEKVETKDKKKNLVDLNMNWQCSKCLYQYSYEANYRKHMLTCKGVLKQNEKSESLLAKSSDDLIEIYDAVKDASDNLVTGQKLGTVDLKSIKESDLTENKNKSSVNQTKNIESTSLAMKSTSLQYHSCPFCHMGFTYTANYRKHVESKACTGTIKIETCKTEQLETKKTLSESSSKKNSSKMEKKYFVCKFCQKRILSKIGLIKHLSVHTKKNKDTEVVIENSQDNNVTNRFGKVKSIIKQRIIDLLKK